jgi:hypothetical protein
VNQSFQNFTHYEAEDGKLFPEIKSNVNNLFRLFFMRHYFTASAFILKNVFARQILIHRGKFQALLPVNCGTWNWFNTLVLLAYTGFRAAAKNGFR